MVKNETIILISKMDSVTLYFQASTLAFILQGINVKKKQKTEILLEGLAVFFFLHQETTKRKS